MRKNIGKRFGWFLAAAAPWMAVAALLFQASPAAAGDGGTDPFPEAFSRHCADHQARTPGVYRVAIRPAAPFIEDAGPLGLDGISIKLWELVAREAGMNFEYVCLTLSDTITGLENRSVDVAIAPLTVTAEREEAINFTHPYLFTSLVAAKIYQSHINIYEAVRRLFASLNIIEIEHIFIFIIIFVIIFIITYINIKKYTVYPKIIQEKKPLKILHMFIFFISNVIGIRKDIFGFSSYAMHIMYFFIVIFGIFAFSGSVSLLTASLVSTIDNNQVTIDASELAKYRLSTMLDSTSEEFLVSNVGISKENLIKRDSWEESLDDLVKQDADFVVGDSFQLEYFSGSSAYKNKIVVGTHSFRLEPYAWGLQAGSEIRENINRNLIKILRSDAWGVILNRYTKNME